MAPDEDRRGAGADPLAALGLPPGADERAVRRAYARRLPGVRPDVDPAGFQALHEAYRAALAAARRPEVEAAVPVQAEPAGDGASSSSGTLLEAADAPAPPELFTLDLGAFAAALLAEAEGGSAEALAAWVAAATADWPLGAREALAPHLLDALAGAAAGLAPEPFDAVSRAFGFDDVLGGLDPLRVAGARAGLAARRAHRLRAAALAEALDPANRAVLCRRMDGTDRGGYAPAATRLLAAIVTGPRSAGRARVLRLVPLLSGPVARFIGNLDEGRTDAFGDAIPPETVAVWARTEERREAFARRTAGIRSIVVLALFLGGAALHGFGSAPSSPARPAVQGPGRAVSASEAMAALTAVDLQDQLDDAGRALAVGNTRRAVDAYDRIVALYGPAPPAALAGTLCNVYFGRAVLLDTFGRRDEARDAYALFERAFARADDPDTRALLLRSRERRAALGAR